MSENKADEMLPAMPPRFKDPNARRDYEREAIALEAALLGLGVLNDHTQTLSLVDLVTFYGVAYTHYGPLSTTAPEELQIIFDAPKTPAVVVSEPEETKIVHKLSDDQERALAKLLIWAKNDEPFFVLRGFAGTGKTYLMQLLEAQCPSMYFSAPTNKATKVLGTMVGRKAKTTYSMLGLKMEHVEDQLILTQSGTPPYFPSRSIIVIDEAGMVATVLDEAVRAAVQRCKIKILYVGDPAQLTPVGESKSPAWSASRDPACRAMLSQVMRFDNQLLALSTELRTCIKTKTWESPISSNHDDVQGVWKWRSQDKFEAQILKWASSASDLSDTKVIAWRNKTVEHYNSLIRKKLGFFDTYCVGDVLLLAGPIEENGSIVAHTDEEFKVLEVEDDIVDVEGTSVQVWRLQVTGEQTLVLRIAKDQSQVDLVLSRKASVAKKAPQGYIRRAAWKDFWDTKAKFNTVRYGFAFTAHRAQGSTVHTAYVDQMDILANHNKKEAFRCLYVACTRATTRIHSY